MSNTTTPTEVSKNTSATISEVTPPATTVENKTLTPTAADAKANPFKAIAMILGSVRISLEDSKAKEKPPRWIRMVRIRNFQGESDYISKAVIPVLGGLSTAILHLMNLTLQAKDMLTQADAATAMWEVSENMLTIVTTDEFSTAIAQAINPEANSVDNPLSSVRPFINTVSGFINRIPISEDLDLLGSEFFRLFSIELLPLNETGLSDATESHININTTGKLRLIQMALNKPITVHGLGKDKKDKQEITYLGGRRLWKTDKLPSKALAKWGDPKKPETIYEFNFADSDKNSADLIEVNNLLDKLGYIATVTDEANKKLFADDLAKRLRSFQKLNGLSVNGKLDNSTLNRLMHFNFETKSIERAVAFDATKLPEKFDDSKDDTAA